MARPMELCPDDQLAQLAELAASDTRKGLKRLEGLLRTHGGDPRLLFLKGSLLAALQRYDEAVAPMAEAVEIAPEFHIARFQLGLLHLSSGAAPAALDVWSPLARLPTDDPLRLFAEGLAHLSRDEFDQAERLLRHGMALNRAYPAVNGDMQKVLDELPREPATPAGDETESQANWLLRLSERPTKH